MAGQTLRSPQEAEQVRAQWIAQAQAVRERMAMPGRTDPAELARRIRVHLAPSIVQQIYGPSKELDVIALEPELERMVAQALNSPHGAALDPGVADALTRHAARSSASRRRRRSTPAATTSAGS